MSLFVFNPVPPGRLKISLVQSGSQKYKKHTNTYKKKPKNTKTDKMWNPGGPHKISRKKDKKNKKTTNTDAAI